MLPRVNLVRSDQGEFLAFGTDVLSNQLFHSGAWEKNLLSLGLLLVQRLEAPLVLDIGANLGAFTVPMAERIQRAGGQVIAFEPQRIVYYQLCGNIFLNRLENVHAINKAVGDQDAVIQIPKPDYARLRNIGAFSIEEKYRKLNGTQAAMSSTTESVPIITLDSFEVFKPPALIKLDVEGYELNVLQGATNFLRRNDYPPILFEAWSESWFAEEKTRLLDFTRSLGYEIIAMGGYDHLAQHAAKPLVRVDKASDGTLHLFPVTASD
ncbi:MAG: FkbM family methyltransferase [Pseudomonadales bacterium]|jgi:FkbM family methyltransferase|nr:FkbM family methyltransferase [Pseudomonadales bacterium]